MNKLVGLLAGASLVTVAMVACGGDETEGGDDDTVEAGASSSSSGSSSSSSGSSSSSSGGSGGSSGGSSGASTSSGGSTSSSGDAGEGNRCDQASARVEARYAACDVDAPILDAGPPPPCTDARAEDNERIADCVEAASCPALRADPDAGAEAAEYYACVGF